MLASIVASDAATGVDGSAGKRIGTMLVMALTSQANLRGRTPLGKLLVSTGVH
jgi:hypothetical protein